MFRPARLLLLLMLLPAGAALASNTQIASDKPIINFRLPNFTPEGFRAWLVKGSEARFTGPNEIAIRELTLSIFSGKADEKIDTLLLSPSAVVHPAKGLVTGPDSIRVIDDRFEASGTDWSYEQKGKKVSINHHVRVVFRAEIKDLLQ